MITSKCEICYKDIDEGQKKAFCNNCGQDYHGNCINQAIQTKNMCPMCKGSFVDKTLTETTSHATKSTYVSKTRPRSVSRPPRRQIRTREPETPRQWIPLSFTEVLVLLLVIINTVVGVLYSQFVYAIVVFILSIFIFSYRIETTRSLSDRSQNKNAIQMAFIISLAVTVIFFAATFRSSDLFLLSLMVLLGWLIFTVIKLTYNQV